MVPKLTAVLLPLVLMASPVLGLQDKPAQQKQTAPASYSSTKVEFTLAVTGLTKENASKIQGALDKLSMKGYACPHCGSHRASPGECLGCETELVERESANFQNLKPAPDKGTVAFRLEPNAQVKLTQIEKALRDHSIKIDRAKSDFGKSATFVFQGGTSADDATHLKEAFKTAKLGNAVASVDSKSKDIHVQVKEGTPDWAAISKVGETLSTPLRLTDVIWGLTPKTAKG
jgi:hypothetical protein